MYMIGTPGILRDPALQVPITRRHDVTLVRLHSPHQTVIGIRAFVTAFQTLEARVLGHTQRDAVLGAELLELAQHAVGDAGDGLGKETGHGGGDEVEFVLDGEVDEVGVDQ